MQCGQEYSPRRWTRPDSCTLIHNNWERNRNHFQRKPCDWALFRKVWLLSIIISISQQQELQSYPNSRWSVVFIGGVSRWSFKENRKHYQGLSTNGGDVDRQTKRTVWRKNIRELEKEAAYERLHWYCVKKCKDHGGPITDIKDLNKLV